MLYAKVGEECGIEVLDKRQKSVTEMLERIVVEKRRRRVLSRRFVHKCWRKCCSVPEDCRRKASVKSVREKCWKACYTEMLEKSVVESLGEECWAACHGGCHGVLQSVVKRIALV